MIVQENPKGGALIVVARATSNLSARRENNVLTVGKAATLLVNAQMVAGTYLTKTISPMYPAQKSPQKVFRNLKQNRSKISDHLALTHHRPERLTSKTVLEDKLA